MTSSGSFREADAVALAAIMDGGAWTAASILNLGLRHHCRELNRAFLRMPKADAEHVLTNARGLLPVVAARSKLLTEPHRLEHQIVPALIRLCYYAGQSERNPRSWTPSTSLAPEDQWSDLVRHLFGRYPLPRFFDSAWLVPGCARYLERDWFCHLAQGGSWRKAHHMPPSITTKALHHAMSAPDHLTIRQALRWGQLSALAASPELTEQVLASPMVKELSNDAVWSRLFEKLTASRDFDPREFGIISDLLLDLVRQDQWQRARSLVALPLAELRRHCYRRWREILRFAQADGVRLRDDDLFRQGLRMELLHIARASWNPMPNMLPFEAVRDDDHGSPSRWTIHERHTQAQLLREGDRLRHCVGWYWRRCKRGKSAIFSLVVWQGDRALPRVTIEVDRASRRIVQIRAKYNDYPGALETELISRWAAENDLRIAV